MEEFLSTDENGDEQYYTAAELSKIAPVRFHPGTVTRWADRGVRGQILKSMRFGGKRLFKKSDLLEFLEKINDEQPSSEKTEAENAKMSAFVGAMLNPGKKESSHA